MVLRTRLAILLISFAVIGLELVLMRILSLRFWSHFASMVISVGLLGFGFSGTLVTLAQNRFRPHRRLWLTILAFAASLSVLLSAWAVQAVPLDVYYLAWNLPAEWFHILEIELLMMLPFTLVGGFLGLVLMDRSERIHGHYGVNLVGSGAGAVLSVAMMFYLSTTALLILLAFFCYGAGLLLTQWKNRKAVGVSLIFGLILLPAAWLVPSEIRISPYKRLAQERLKPQSEVVLTAESPLGRIDVVEGPAIHDAPPGMSLRNPCPIPKRTLVIVDGEQTHILYAYEDLEDLRFLDYTTTALPFFLVKAPQTLVIGPGGGAAPALAAMHGSSAIVALADNRQMVDLIRERFAEEGGRIYQISEGRVHFEAPRGYLRRTEAHYDLILIPLLDPAGPGGGLQAAQENYLYTVESFRTLLQHLKKDGTLCVTVHAKTPPRDGLRLFNTAVEALSREGLSPADRLVLIRSWETVSLLAGKSAWPPGLLHKVREFCNSRGFDLCYLPGLETGEINQYHLLPAPYYYDGARQLLSPERNRYIQNYLFALDAPTDDRPYFNHFIRWRHLPELRRQLKGRIPAFLELGSLMLLTALAQVLFLAGVLVLLPLFSRMPGLRSAPNKGRILVYFFSLGLGFMLLEMGFLQKMILYLSHPIYSAAAVIASFLVFAGVGSRVSGRWKRNIASPARGAACVVVIVGLLYLFLLDSWLSLTQSWNLSLRFLITALTIAPLALAMGHLFPMGLRRVSEAVPTLVPWSWAVNGFASVLATVSAPLLAMSIGFSRLIVAAMVCYVLAGCLFSSLLRGVEASVAESIDNP
ncbi:MAG: hypothetical protein ACOWYE_05780 [Desulfatiglandales bacterium]